MQLKWLCIRTAIAKRSLRTALHCFTRSLNRFAITSQSPFYRFSIALHRFASHCIALHCIALHCIALHCIASLCIALHCIALHCIALHRFALHFIALHCIASLCIALHCIALRNRFAIICDCIAIALQSLCIDFRNRL
jgi:hypothetical protein